MNKVSELRCTGCTSKLTCAHGNISYGCYMSTGDANWNRRVSITPLYKTVFLNERNKCFHSHFYCSSL